MEGMTKEEMQRFFNREAEKGSTEYEALKALADILGIEFPELKQLEKAKQKNYLAKKPKRGRAIALAIQSIIVIG